MGIRFDRRLRLIMAGCCTVAVAVTGASLAARPSPNDADALRRQHTTVTQQKKQVQSRLRDVKRQQRAVTRQLQTLDQHLERTEQKLNVVTADANSTKARLNLATQEYQTACDRLVEQQDCVSERLVAIYEQGETKPAEVLLQASSFTDFANRLYLVNTVVERDSEILNDYADAQADADAKRDTLAERHQELQVVQTQVTEEKIRTEAERQFTARKKQSILRNRLIYERELAALEQNSREIEQMLRRLQRTQGGRSRVATPHTGAYRMPVSGRLTSPYGYRMHPVLKVRKLHTGLDLAASTGTPIHAAGGGVVVFSGRWGGYGNCIIIDHGGNTATLYGHCSRLAVSANETVKTGDVIGYVGSTGMSTGPHLHFEVRRNGTPVDPMGYL